MADNEFNNPEEAFETNNNALFDEVNDVNPDVDQALGEDANVDENNDVNNNNNNGEDDVEPPSYNQDEGNENENANQAESDKKEINDIMENIFGGSDEEDSVGKQDKPSDARSDLDEDELERENNKKMEKIKQKKNKKRKKSDEDDEGSDKKKRKKRKKERQIEEDGQDQDDAPRPSSEGQQQDDIEAKFKEVLERSKKKRYKGPSEQEVDETVDKTLDMMSEAFEDDMNAINNKQPALKRLAILPTILEQLARIPLHDKLLEKGACEQIRAWLQPLPDNTLPNLKIREGLLRVLLKFNGINSSHLSESLLGRIVLMLSRRTDETKENRKMAATLVTKWARPIFGLDDKPNAADMIPQQNFAPAPKALPKKSVAASQNNDIETERNTAISAPRAAIPELLAKKGHGYVRARAAVPEKARMDYTMKPASKLDDAMPIKKSTGARVKSNRLDKLIKGKEVASGGRASSMNITKGSLE